MKKLWMAILVVFFYVALADVALASVKLAHNTFPFVRVEMEYDVAYGRSWYKGTEFHIDKAKLIQYAREGKNLDAIDSHGWSALHYATYKGWTEAVRALLENGANPNIQQMTNERLAPLHYAVRGEVETVILLLEYRADVNIQTGEYHKKTPLHISAELGVPEVTSTLLQNGADHRIKDWVGYTALYIAVRAEKLDNVKLLLLKEGADIQTHRETLFDMAMEKGNHQIARLVSKDIIDYWQRLWQFKVNKSGLYNFCKRAFSSSSS